MVRRNVQARIGKKICTRCAEAQTWADVEEDCGAVIEASVQN